MYRTVSGEGRLAPDADDAPADEDPRDYRVEFSKIRDVLGFEITRRLRDGVQEIRQAIEQFLKRDRVIAHAHAGGVVDGVGDRRGHAAQAQFGHALGLHRGAVGVRLVEEDDLLHRHVPMHRDLVAGEVVVDEEADLRVDDQLLRQRAADAHGHRADDLAACLLGVEDASRGAHRQHPAHAGFAACHVHGDLGEMRGECGQLFPFVEVAELDRVLDHDLAIAGRLAQGHATIACADFALAEFRGVRAEPESRRHHLAQLHAGGVDAGGRTVAAPLAARAGGRREVGIAEPHLHLRDVHAHHLGRGLGDDRVAARADVGHVGFDRDPARAIEPRARAGRHHRGIAEAGGHAHADSSDQDAHRGHASEPRSLLGAT